MKKIISGALIVLSVVSGIFGQEENSKIIGKPSLEVKDSLTLKGADDQLGNFKPNDFENSLEANFSVGFSVNEMLKINPFLSNEVVFAIEGLTTTRLIHLESNTFKAGLGLGLSPMDMLNVSFKLGYAAKMGYEGLKLPAPHPMLDLFTTNGFFLGANMGVNVENLFLECSLGYSLEATFGKYVYDDKSDAIAKLTKFKNKLSAELTFDFFNFIKDGLNSGLILSNEVKFKNDFSKTLAKSNKTVKSNEIENEFSAGFHFNPVNYIDCRFLTKIGHEQKKLYNPISDKWKSVKNTSIGLTMNTVFTHKNFSFGLEYNPTLWKKDVDADGNISKFEKKAKNHELKIVVGFSI